MSWGCIKKTGCGCLIISAMLMLSLLTCLAFIVLGGWVWAYEHIGWILKAADKYGLIHLPWYLKL